MINRLSMNVDQVAGHLVKLGILYKRINRTEEPEVEDDEITVTDSISVQVSSYGDAYISVSRWVDEDTIMHYPERLDVRMVAADIRQAMEDEKNAKA